MLLYAMANIQLGYLTLLGSRMSRSACRMWC